MNSKLCIIAFALALVVSGGSASAAPAPVVWENPLQDKIFLLLSLLERDPAIEKALASDPALAEITRAKSALLLPPAVAPVDNAAKLSREERKKAADAAEKAAMDANLNALLWTDAEIKTIGDTLRALHDTTPALASAVREKLRLTGLFAVHDKLSGPDLLALAWSDAARNANHVIKTYGLGQRPYYHKIDALAYSPDDPYHTLNNFDLLSIVQDDPSAKRLFFQPSLRLATLLLQSHMRDYAAHFEPLHEGENAAAFRRAATLDWNAWPRSAILVLGHGPQIDGVPFSPSTRAQLHTVARRFHAGSAPFLILSGGRVWPAGTLYYEGLEMKRVLMGEHGIPENAIIIDPHARHTTTNFRNAGRLLHAFGAPEGKPVTVLSTPRHMVYVKSERFARACQRECGFVPFKIISSSGPLELECVIPLALCRQSGIDPLDP